MSFKRDSARMFKMSRNLSRICIVSTELWNKHLMHNELHCVSKTTQARSCHYFHSLLHVNLHCHLHFSQWDLPVIKHICNGGCNWTAGVWGFFPKYFVYKCCFVGLFMGMVVYSVPHRLQEKQKQMGLLANMESCTLNKPTHYWSDIPIILKRFRAASVWCSCGVHFLLVFRPSFCKNTQWFIHLKLSKNMYVLFVLCKLIHKNMQWFIHLKQVFAHLWITRHLWLRFLIILHIFVQFVQQLIGWKIHKYEVQLLGAPPLEES